jgi:hypothetical protein
LYLHATTTLITARVPLTSVDFSLIDLDKHGHMEVLNKEETQKLGLDAFKEALFEIFDSF